MTSIAQTFASCAAKKRKALIPFLTSGYPDQKLFRRALDQFVLSGADIIEVGIPFSDPLADGPVIQQASQQALTAGVTIDRTLQSLRAANSSIPVPLVLMSYYNPIRAYGLSRFAERAYRAGVSGLIVPDLIWEEASEVEQVCRDHHLDLIHLVARTSPPARRKQIIRRSRGFVYLVSVTGVTGTQQTFSRGLTRWIGKVKQESPLPVCVGFGISTPAQARELSRAADGVIIGSAIINIVRRTNGSRKTINNIGAFLHRIREGIDHE